MITVNNRLEYLSELSKLLPKQSKGVEIGVLYGDFSDMILKEINPRCLFLVDPYKYDESKTYDEAMNNLAVCYSTETDYLNVLDKFKQEIKSAKVFVLKSLSHVVVRYIKEDLFDFIYFDGSHLYDDLKRDTNDWLPKLKVCGFICGHDYIQHKSFGVIQAVDEFIKEHDFEMIILNKNGGDFALRKIKQ